MLGTNLAVVQLTRADMSTNYLIIGPAELKVTKNAHGAKRLDKAKSIETLSSLGFLGLRGCYIFGTRVAHGVIHPYYVGKTAKSFGQECFQPHKIEKYNDTLHHAPHGTPLMLFVVPKATRGAFNEKSLAALEQYLIGLAYQTNPDIQNLHGLPKPMFLIEGVQKAKMGPKGPALTAFLRTFDV
jgi:hypothetical protein